MTQVPSAPGHSGGLDRVQPISVVGPFMCGIGGIWTLLNYFKLCGGINRLEPSANLQAWTIFVPIYGNLYLSQVIGALNRIAPARGVNLPPLPDNIILNFLFALFPLYQMMERYNAIADAVDGKRPA